MANILDTILNTSDKELQNEFLDWMDMNIERFKKLTADPKKACYELLKYGYVTQEQFDENYEKAKRIMQLIKERTNDG